MGISVIGTWRNFDLVTLLGQVFAIPLSFGKYQAFINQVQFYKFQLLSAHCDQLIGFNSIGFDDKLCHANGLVINTDFDLLCEVRIASGQPPFYTEGITRSGYSLEALALANLGQGKTGSGELAPKLWQMGHQDKVIKYCLNDVKLLKQLYFRFLRHGLIDPTNQKLLKYQGEK
jgi:hypothetical protein